MLEIKRRLHVDQDYILEKTRKHGEYKYTADDYWTARIDNHKIMLLPLHCQYWYDQRNLTSYCKITWEFYFAKNKNSLPHRWHDKFLPKPYACWHLWKPYTYAACFALSFVKLFVTLVRFVSCFQDQDHKHSTYTCADFYTGSCTKICLSSTQKYSYHFDMTLHIAKRIWAMWKEKKKYPCPKA